MCHTGSGRNCNTVLILLVSCQQTCMTHTIALCKVKNYDGQRNCSKYVEFYSKNKFEKLVDLVRFIIRNPPPIFHLVPNLVQYFHFAGYKHNRGFYFNTVINYNVQWSQTNIETGNTIFSLIQQSELSVRWPNVQVSGSHIIRHTHTHTVGLFWTSDQLISETATYTRHTEHKKPSSMPPAEFEAAIQVIEMPQTWASDSTTTRIGEPGNMP